MVSALTAALGYDMLVAEVYGEDFLKIGRKPKLTPHQRREAIKRRDVDGEPICDIARSYNVHSSTICRLSSADSSPFSIAAATSPQG